MSSSSKKSLHVHAPPQTTTSRQTTLLQTWGYQGNRKQQPEGQGQAQAQAQVQAQVQGQGPALPSVQGDSSVDVFGDDSFPALDDDADADEEDRLLLRALEESRTQFNLEQVASRGNILFYWHVFA